MRAFGVAVAVAIVLLASAGPTLAAEPSAGCGSSPPVEPGSTRVLTLEHGGLERSYRLHLPPTYDASKPQSLVLSIHGYTGSAEFSETRFTGQSRHADANGYVVAYPQSTSFEVDGLSVTSWNDLACSASPGALGPTCAADADPYPCPPECGECGSCNWCSCHDDVGFITALLDELEEQLCLDRNRLFAVGFSNGGMFVHRLGCELSGRLTAVAPLAGTLARGFGCAPEGRTSLLLLSGRSDRTVPLDGSRSSDGYFYTPNSEVATSWAGGGSCSERPTPRTTPWDGHGGLECVEHAGCSDGSLVESCTWSGAHVWPRVGGVDDPDADHFGNELLWDFFERAASREASKP